MNHWLRDATQAAHYAKHGWPTVDQKCRLRRESESVRDKYERTLKTMLKAIPAHADKALSCAQLAKKVKIPPGTAKKHIGVLFPT